MRYLLRQFLLISVLFLSGPAFADFEMCVAPSRMSDLCSGATYKTASGSPDWSLDCGGIKVSGISVCAFSGTSAGTYGVYPYYSAFQYSANGAGTLCLCRLVEPVVSAHWVKVVPVVNVTTTNCPLQCGYWCAERIANLSQFRNAIFNTLQ